MSFSNAAYESADKVKIIQEQKLHELLVYTSKYSLFYRELFAKHKVDIRTINTPGDLSRIPTTSKEDLQQRSEDFLCVGREKIIEYTSTSGTLGSPVIIALTENDLNRLAYNEYNSFLTADGSANDIYQLMLTLDRQFMAGIAYYSGIRKLGAGIIRLGPGVPSLQWETIHRLKPTTIVTVPSFVLKLIQFAKDNFIDINRSSVKKAICIGENIRNTDFSLNMLGRKIKEEWNIHLFSTYASTEIGLDEVLFHLQTIHKSEECDHRIRAYLQARLRVSPHIKYVAAEEIKKMQFADTGRKAVKFIDRRG